MQYEKQRATIVGLGREGTALAKYLAQRGATVSVSDIKGKEALRNTIDELAELPIKYHLGEHPEELLDTDVIFVSPGVPQDIPLLLEARQRGIPISSETQLFFSLCRAPIIGITGSSGKTTTTSLVGRIMQAEGYRTYVGGNIGFPLLPYVDEIGPQDKVVMELSSFQLEVLDRSPHIAAILNLSADHLDRHASMDDYVAAKVNIIRFQDKNDYSVLNADQQLTRQLAQDCPGHVMFFSTEGELVEGAFLSDGHIVTRWQTNEQEVCHVSQVQLLGAHNVENVLAACAIAVLAGAQVDAIASSVMSFAGVEHRLERVEEIDGVQYYDDSIATSPSRTIAALNSFAEQIILLAGGREKHLPLHALARLVVQKVKVLILFGEAAPLLEEAVIAAQGKVTRDGLPIHRCSTLAEAVRTAARLGKPGDIVLLSPACTSFDMYRDFAERGDHFKALVRELTDSQER